MGFIPCFLACETEVEIDIPKDDTRLVVNAILEEDSTVSLQLSESRFSLSSDPIQNVVGATVTLFENDIAVATLKDTVDEFQQEGWYVTDYRPKEDASYRISASKEGYPGVEAQIDIPKAVEISNVDYGFQTIEETIFIDDAPTIIERKQLTTVDLMIDDPVGEDNYYEVVMYQDGAFQFVYDFDDEGAPFITDTLIRRFEVYLSTEDPIFSEGDVLDGDDYFYGNSLVFSDESFNGKNYTLKLNFEGSSGFSLDPVSDYIIFLRSISREQYLYFRSLELQYETEGNPFAEPVPVYNNIAGGYGIFVGFSHDHRRIIL